MLALRLWPPIGFPAIARAKMRHIRNSLAISSLLFRKFLFSLPCVTIGALGDERLFRLSDGKASSNRLPAAPAGRPQRAAAFGFFGAQCGEGY